MADEDYEILSHKDIVALKKEISKIKEKSKGGAESPMQESIENLAETINDMMDMFKEAAQEYKADEAEEIILSKKIDPLVTKIDLLLEQNKKIASGIVALADLIRESMAEREKHKEEKKQAIIPPRLPGMMPPSGMGMPPPAGLMPPPRGMPPPPPMPPPR